MAAEYDLVIRGGTLADGTGGPLAEADVAVTGDRIAAIGKRLAAGAEEIDARGHLVTPGFVDVHTHYDGQAIWSEDLAPSSAHGVTTVVMGNCGVGFAPCRKADHELLIKVMEGVEDIPGVVMAEGLAWDWETFPEYLDRVAAGRRDIDVAAYLPHSPLRVYAMGERGARREPASADDLALMRRLAAEAMAAGAIGFSTSRLSIHRTADGGAIPSFAAEVEELKAICGGMTDAGAGTFQIVPDAFGDWDREFALIAEVARACGRPATFTLASANEGAQKWQEGLAFISAGQAEGLDLTGQVMPRPIGLVAGLELSVHAFVMCPSWAKIAALPLAGKVAAMRDPAMRAALLAETPAEGHPLTALGRTWRWMFPLDDPPDYAPPPERSVLALAAAAGVSPEEYVYDAFVESEGEALFLAALGNFADNSLASAHAMLAHPRCVPALGDGGAHYGAICDASYSTFLLDHFCKRSDALAIPLEAAVHMLSAKAARAVGLRTRGVLRAGAKADINVIDLDRLALHKPGIVRDLPAGGRRLDQRATGYAATLVSGQVIRRDDTATGARPGQLVRGGG